MFGVNSFFILAILWLLAPACVVAPFGRALLCGIVAVREPAHRVIPGGPNLMFLFILRRYLRRWGWGWGAGVIPSLAIPWLYQPHNPLAWIILPIGYLLLISLGLYGCLLLAPRCRVWWWLTVASMLFALALPAYFSVCIVLGNKSPFLAVAGIGFFFLGLFIPLVSPIMLFEYWHRILRDERWFRFED